MVEFGGVLTRLTALARAVYSFISQGWLRLTSWLLEELELHLEPNISGMYKKLSNVGCERYVVNFEW